MALERAQEYVVSRLRVILDGLRVHQYSLGPPHSLYLDLENHILVKPRCDPVLVILYHNLCEGEDG